VSNGSAEQITIDGSTVSLTNGATGTTTTNGMTYNISVSGGTATVVLTKAAGVSSSATGTLINGLAYQNTSQDPTAGARTFTLAQIVDTGGVAVGGVDTTNTTISSTVTVVPVNDAPTLSATAVNGTYTEDAAATSIFSGTAISTIESGQAIKSLTFTVGNISDGSAEQISIDGSTISLTNGATGTTTANGMTYNISVSGGTATVVLTKAAGVSSGNISSLINGLTYQNTSQDPTAGARTFTLTQIVDTGGLTNGGVDTTNATISSTVTVVAVNDAPTLSATAVNGTYTEDAAATSIFSGTAISTIESGQAIKSLTFTVGNVTDGAAERMTIDGSTIALTNGATGTTTANGMTYNISVSGGTATVVLT